MTDAVKRTWQSVLSHPLAGRNSKPRTIGLTMVIDTGSGVGYLRDLLEVGAPYVDIVKFGFGTSYLYPTKQLRDKITLLHEHQIRACPGGTFLECAVAQGKWIDYLKYVQELGFGCIEVSDGTITMEDSLRAEMITRSIDLGLSVITEVGKKEDGSHPSPLELETMIRRDLAYGSSCVIVEGRESGKDVGLYHKDGSLRTDEWGQLLDRLGPLVDKVMWEAPLKTQQQSFIVRLGPNVSLGNISWNDIIALEALRCGLRSDTLRHALQRQELPSRT